MNEFFTYVSQHPWWGAVLVALLALTVMMFVFAARSGKKRGAARDAVIQALEKEKALRKEFAALTPETFADPDDAHLLCGIAAHLQMKLEKAENMTAAFSALPQCAQTVASSRETVILPQSAQYHAGMRWPHQS